MLDMLKCTVTQLTEANCHIRPSKLVMGKPQKVLN